MAGRVDQQSRGGPSGRSASRCEPGTLRERLRTFADCERGLVTVDWVALSAVTTLMALTSVYSLGREGLGPLVGGINRELAAAVAPMGGDPGDGGGSRGNDDLRDRGDDRGGGGDPADPGHDGREDDSDLDRDGADDDNKDEDDDDRVPDDDGRPDKDNPDGDADDDGDDQDPGNGRDGRGNGGGNGGGNANGHGRGEADRDDKDDDRRTGPRGQGRGLMTAGRAPSGQPIAARSPSGGRDAPGTRPAR